MKNGGIGDNKEINNKECILKGDNSLLVTPKESTTSIKDSILKSGQFQNRNACSKKNILHFNNDNINSNSSYDVRHIISSPTSKF
jgi:hypothetical protein